MDRRSQRYREKVHRTGDGFATRLVQGNGQFINLTNTSTIASDSSRSTSPLEKQSVVFEPPRSSFKKASGTPIKTLIHEELSREKKVRKSSPSVIARLMGLDTLPPLQTVTKQQKEISSSPKRSYEDHSLRMSTSEHQVFKDVFEINDSTKVEKHTKHSVFKETSRLKQNETDEAFVRQKFMEAKRLSSDETLQNSKEFNDAIEVLHSNKDLFLKFLQEPNSLFTKYAHDLKCSPSAPHESHITLLKSTKGKMYETDEASCKSEVKNERYTHMQKDGISSSRKPATNLFDHTFKEHSGSLSHKLLKSHYAGKTVNNNCTQIVVLKPNLEKFQNMARKVSQPSFQENCQFGYRRHKESQHSGLHNLHAEEKKRHSLFDNVDILGQKMKSSREIAKEITKQMKHSVSTGSDKKLASGFNRYIKNESLMKNSEAYQQTPFKLDYWNSTSRPSSPSSTESSVSREARKRLSERWRLTNRHHEESLVGKGSSTLGEMLALSEREVPRGILDSVTVQEVSDEKSAEGMLQSQCYSSGISSSDGWMDGCSRNLSRSSSLSASPIVYGTPKSSSRRLVSDSDSCYMLKDVLNLGIDESFHENVNHRGSFSHRSFKFHSYKPHISSGGEENKLPVREIHVNEEKLRSGCHAADNSELKPMSSKIFDSTIANPCNPDDSFSVVESRNAEMSSITCEAHVQKTLQKSESSHNSDNNEVVQEASPDHPQVDSLSSPSNTLVSDSPISSKEADQPSPVSVLEPPSEEIQSSPECFERVGADLQELRIQLQLLKMESDAYNNESEAYVSSEDESEVFNSPIQKEKTMHTYIDEEDRDFSYLLDILGDLGVHGTYCFPSHLVDATVFEKLEEKYGDLLEWSKSERKLLFDLISFIIAEVVSSCMDQHPWVKLKRKLGRMWDRERLAKEVHQMVVRLQEEFKEFTGGKPERILDPKWLDSGDDVDTVGSEIEGMLKEDLLEELVAEFILY